MKTTLIILSQAIIWSIAYYFLRPTDSPDYHTDLSFAELKEKYEKIDRRGGLRFIFLWILLTVLIGLVIQYLSAFMFSLINARIFVTINPIAFYCVAILFAIKPASKLCENWLKTKTDWSEYQAFYKQKHQMEFTKGDKYIARPAYILGVLVLVVCLNTYSIFRETSLTLNPLLGFSKTYKYSEVKEIRSYEYIKAPNGKIRQEKSFQIEMKDHRNWENRNNGFDDIDKDFEIVEFVSNKSGLRIIEKDTTGKFK